MRGIFYVLTALAVMGLAFWAYQENYRTQNATVETERLQRQIGDREGRLSLRLGKWGKISKRGDLLSR